MRELLTRRNLALVVAPSWLVGFLAYSISPWLGPLVALVAAWFLAELVRR